MKKLFGLALAFLCSMSMFADRLFMVGDATPQGWNVGTSEMKATELIETAPGIFTWTGKLNVGGEGFKVSTAIGQWGNWHPSNGYSGKLDQTSDVMREGDPDTKWQVSQEGIYTVTINWNTKEISAVKETYTLSQDSEGYYLLGNAEDLFYFSQWSCHGAIDNKSKAKLTADIDFTAAKYKYASIGVADYANAKACFSGEFDGQGHTITVAIEGLRDRAGLFGFVRDAVIKNLVVDGTLSSSRNCSGGLGGRVDGSVTVDNVIVKTALTFTTGSGDATFGGFFANVEGNDVFTNCAFIGSINVGGADGCGGLVGWAGSGSNTKFINCYVAPNSYTKNGNSADYARNSPTVTNCYAIEQADPRFATGELCYLLNNKVSGGEGWYQTIGTDKMPVPFATSSKVYANGALDCAGNSKGGDLVYSNNTGGSRDPHTVVEGFCSVCHELITDYITPVDGYLPLGSAGDLKWFSALVNAGNTSVNAKLTADINMTGVEYTPIGTGANKYSGEFDGQNHTVDNIVIEGKSYSGFFGYLTGGANIHNLVIGAGCAFSGEIKIGGLASMADGGGTVTLNRVVNMASATSSTSAADANAAGLISCCVGGTKVAATYCLNAGKIVGKPGECAAFTGWSQGGSSYTNCINIAEVEGMQDNRNLFRGDATAVTCYDATYSTQGTKVDAAKLATGELCFILNGSVNGGEGWYQTLPGDAYPLPLTNHSKVYQNGDYYCDHVTAKGSSSYSNVEGATYDDHVFGTNDLCENCKAEGKEPAKDVDVYQIANIGQLVWFATSVNGGNTTAKAELTADIEQGDAKLASIGTQANPYHAKFIGNFHTVTLAMESDNDYQGLFGVLTNGAEIYNLTTAGSVKGKSFVGGIAGGTNGGGEVKFINVGNEATVTATNANAGGILGVDMGSGAKITMINVYNAGAIKGAKENGGLSGWAGDQPNIINAYNIAEVENGDGFLRCNGADNFNNTYGKDQATPIAASGELCAKLDDTSFRQEVGTGHPVFDQTLPNVVSATVSSARYATYVAGEDVKFNAEGLEAYVVSSTEKGYIKLESVTEIPKYEAVILEANEGTYYFNTTTDAAVPEANQLVADLFDVTADGTQYILAQVEDEVGFKKATPGTTIAAGKGYLVVTGSDVKAFYGFNDNNETAISEITNNSEKAAIYNLQGVKLMNAQKGINIIGGKKVVIK